MRHNDSFKKYYIQNQETTIGPFTKQELRDLKITKETPIWSEDMKDWKKAGEIDELKIILLLIPINILANKTSTGSKKSKSFFNKIITSLKKLNYKKTKQSKF